MPSLDIKIAGEEPAVPQILKIDAIWVVAVQVATETLESSTEKAGFCRKTVEFNGRTYPALYTPTNDTLINVFGITCEEQKELKTIIDGTEHRRRQIIAIRQSGVMSRFEYEDRAEQRRVQARLLNAKGYTSRQIAAELGISRTTVSNYLKHGM